MGSRFVFVLPLLLSVGHGVPPNPADRFWDELNNARSIMTNIATQLEKFNSLYLSKLEQKIVSISSTLSSIDSNVKNLQERAHVWDTFQLHVAAWNEQINTLDKKVEIISKGQEKMFILDGKINSISNIEYKVERILGKLDDTSSTINKLTETQTSDPLLNEFTSRGVLSTLKIIERKLDKLQLQCAGNQLAKQRREELEPNRRLSIKCSTPPNVELLLNDVASKVDVMFDKFTSGDDENEDAPESGETSSSVEAKSDPDIKLLRNLLKRLNQPCKRTVKVLESLETSVKAIDNTTLAILEDGKSGQEDVASACQKAEKSIKLVADKTIDIVNRLDEMSYGINERLVQEQEFVSSHFREQREHFAGILQSEMKKINVRASEPGVTNNGESTTTARTADDTNVNVIKTFLKNCEDVWKEPSGIYMFGDHSISSGRNFHVRYCEKGGWTVIQRRGLNPLVQMFNLSWTEYKVGFGDLDKDFWYGNDYIHLLSAEPSDLRIELEDFEGRTAWAEYSTFFVGNETDKFRLKVDGYRGNANDSLTSHNGAFFSTYDNNNDRAPICCPCSPSYGGGWWFTSCFEANLNGIYQNEPHAADYYRGIIWENWQGNYSLKKSKMMVRSKKLSSFLEPTWGSGFEDPLLGEIPEDP